MRFGSYKAFEWFFICLPLLLGLVIASYLCWPDYNKLLLHAVRAGSVDSAKRLMLDKRADVNCQNELGFTPLMLAASRGQIEIAELLILSKADLNMRDKIGRTAAILAAINNHPEILQMLITNGADISIESQGGLNIYKIASTNNSLLKILDQEGILKE